jgi:hypothetical protein
MWPRADGLLRSVIVTTLLLACWSCLCAGMPLLPLAGPSEVPCKLGATVTIAPLAPDPQCGPSMTSWRVALESGHNVQRSAEVYLGDLATTEGPLTLTVNGTASEFIVNSSKRLQRLEGTSKAVQEARYCSDCCTCQVCALPG